MFFKNKKKASTDLDGIVTFFNSFNAMKAEKTVKKGGNECRLVHSPRELSPACGVALAFKYNERSELKSMFEKDNVEYDGIHQWS